MKRIVFGCTILIMLLACATAQQIAATPTPVPPTLTPTLTETLGPTETPTLTPTPEFTCPNAPETQLKVGDLARVTDGDPPVRVRTEPIVADEFILTVLVEGTEMEILDGPKCVLNPDTKMNFVFWKVNIPSKQAPLNEGWVAEGDAAGYFIEPIPEGEN